MNSNGSQIKPSQSNVMMGNMKNMSYPSSNPGFYNANLQPHDSIPANKWKRESILSRLVKHQRTPFSEPTQISKGNTITTAGGSFALYDTTGGTKIFSYDPARGVVIIAGSLIAESQTTGTYVNISIAGTSQNVGSIIGGNYISPLIIGGTMVGGIANPSSYQVGGTPGVTGNIVYVKSVNFSGSTLSFGTLSFTGGLVTSFS